MFRVFFCVLLALTFLFVSVNGADNCDIELGISFLNVTLQEQGDLFLQWDLNDTSPEECLMMYTVSVTRYDFIVIFATYEKSASFEFTSPCTSYKINVTAMSNGNFGRKGPIKSVDYEHPPAVQKPPTLTNVTLGTTSVNLTYTLEPRMSNFCPITEFYVNGGAYFNVSVPIQDSEEREPVTVQINSLRADSMYLIRASVQNSGGWSNSSIVAFHTLPPDAVD